jgi:hypothetical protein
MRLFLVAVLAAAAGPAVAADLPSRPAGDPLMGCWLERRFVDSDSPGWSSLCFSGTGVGTYADFDGTHGAEDSFGYEAKGGELRQWDPDTPQQARTCTFSISGRSLTVKGCGFRGTYQLKCRDVRVSDGYVSCPPAAK